MSKKEYTTPHLKIVTIQKSDIITASTGSFDGEWVPIGGNKSGNDAYVPL